MVSVRSARGALGLLAIAIAAAASCGARTSMVAVPPPGSWSESLAADRSARDAGFRTDPDSPLPPALRAGYRGNEYFPPDASWYFAGYVETYPAPEKLTVVTTGGAQRPAERYGRVSFVRDGQPLTLQVYRLLDQPSRSGGDGLFLPFKDRTTNKTTYGAGRYVNLEGPEGGPFTLDFNRAYNPSCAYGDAGRFQCPVTPSENTLPVAVEAGERGPEGHTGEAAGGG